MHLIEKIYNWLFQRKRPAELRDAASHNAVARDLGVKVTRTRLPSGGEIVVVEKLTDDDD